MKKTQGCMLPPHLPQLTGQHVGFAALAGHGPPLVDKACIVVVGPSVLQQLCACKRATEMYLAQVSA